MTAPIDASVPDLVILVGGASNFVNCDVKLTVTCEPSEIAELDEWPAIVPMLIGIGSSAVAKKQIN